MKSQRSLFPTVFILFCCAWIRPAVSQETSGSSNRQNQEERRTAKRRRRRLGGVVFHRDIDYAKSGNPRQTLDLLLPEKRTPGGPLPVIVFIHGGAWRAGDKQSAHARLVRFVVTGQFAGVAVNYRLSNEEIWPAQIHDCKAAIRWIHAHAEEYGLNSGRIAVWGSSAGGHLVAMLGVSNGVRVLEGDVGPYTGWKSDVFCVVDFFGPTDFLKMQHFPSSMNHGAAGSPESQLVGGAIQEKKEVVRSANPLTYVTKDDAPFLIMHGTKDPLVPFNQSEILYEALTSSGVEAAFVHVENGGHGFRNPAVLRRVRAFFDKHLLGKQSEISADPIREKNRKRRTRTRRQKQRGVSYIGSTRHNKFIYKTIGERKLPIHIHYPYGWKRTDDRPVMVFFFGGGWTRGSTKQFREQAEYFATRGLVTAVADYRVKSRDGVTPDQCVEDSRSAIRWLRKNADMLGVDPKKLITSGGSAGGHLAACAMIEESCEAEGDDTTISTVPCAMVLFNPVLDLSDARLLKRLGNKPELAPLISPIQHIDKDTPPALILFGTNDRLKVFGDAYWKKAKQIGVRADKFLAEGQGHGFFNRSPWRERTLFAADTFLISLGLLKGKPSIKIPD